MEKTIEIPEGYEARIEGNKVILEQNDESIRNFLYEFIKICGWSEKNFPPRERCLAYLERQKEQKPVEWSEEDENRFNNLCWVIDDSKWNEASKQGFKNFLNALRSRYYWKPSEEQMDALHYVKQFDYGGNRSALESLYYEIKNYFGL